MGNPLTKRTRRALKTAGGLPLQRWIDYRTPGPHEYAAWLLDSAAAWRKARLMHIPGACVEAFRASLDMARQIRLETPSVLP